MQYATLTDKSAKDFSVIPGLAESWTGSDDKLTWTYKLRDGLKWSDGKPLTSEDIAWNVNTARKEGWLNHSAATANLTATAPDPQTVVIKSSVPDPKLPTMDIYILPKHIWGKMSPSERDKYEGEDGVGSGPFVLEKFERGQFARFKANPNYWGGKPAVDKVVLRKFNNPDAMVAALKTGELDAAWDIPGAAFLELKKDPNIVTNEGYQGGFAEVAVNGGDGLAKPHPALLDPEVRKAMAHAIDKDTLVDRVLAGVGKRAETIVPSPDPSWVPELSEDQIYEFDLDKARSILEEAGYKDTDGDGVREMPGGGRPLNFRYMARSDGETGTEIAEFITAWLDEIGIATTVKVVDDSQLTNIIGKGDYDMFAWGWTPYADPDTMLDYMTCDQVSADPEDPDQLLQRRQPLRQGIRPPLQAAEGRARPREAPGDRPRDAHPLAADGRLQRPLGGARHDRLRQGPLHRLDSTAREDRSGDLLQHLADLRAHQAGDRVGGGRRLR